MSCVVVPFVIPLGSIVNIFELYEPYADTGESQKMVSAFTFNATDICAQPVSFPIYKSQPEIYFKVSLIFIFSNERESLPTFEFLNLFIKATEKAAIGASKFIGKNDKIAADKGAVDPMRRELNKINMRGTVVIGEGEMDEAPMLYIGEKLGTNTGPEFDIAVDPLEGTNFAANNLPGALSVIAIAEKNNLFKAPETYMEKISTKVKEKKVVDLDYSVKKNIFNLSNADLSKLRNTKIGFVFQFHELIPELNVMENICLPGWIKNDSKVVDNANNLISYFGLDKLKNKKPYKKPHKI